MVESQEYNEIRVFTRGAQVVPKGAVAILVDYNNLNSLVAALQDVDVLICATGGKILDEQQMLLKASIEAGVQRLIPSQWGGDTRVEGMENVPIAQPKREMAAAVHKAAEEGTISYTFFIGGVWIDYIMGWDTLMSVPKRTFYMHENPDFPIAMTSPAAFGDAIVGALRKPDETRNKYINVELIRLSQNQALKLTQEALPDIHINVIPASMEERYERGVKKWNRGEIDGFVVADILAKCLFTPEMAESEEPKANDLVGVRAISEEDFKAIIRGLHNL